MIWLDVAPGSDEWRMARMGIPTASQFSRIVTSKGAPSKSREGYMHELIAERLLGTWLDSYESEFMSRGTGLEAEAVAYYEVYTDTDTQPGGFCMLDDKRAGCSPDRRVGDGGLELKCPKPSTHVGYMLNHGHEGDYRTQVQGSLWVSECEWWDVMSYHPELPRALVRSTRDEPFIKLLSARVREFCDELEELYGKALEIKESRAA